MDDRNMLRVGDVVRVKNIVGPRMVITGFDAKNREMVHLKWFNRRFELEGEWLHIRSLMKSNPQPNKPMSFRGALIAIRDRLVIRQNELGTNSFELDDGTPLRVFIDSILMPSPAPDVEETVELNEEAEAAA
jgi:uncharacterized protein YodC (DUF2158 family)